MSHTPGPWRVDGVNIAYGDATETARGTQTHVVARVLGEVRGEFKSNARLIASAPDLLEWLKHAEKMLARAREMEAIHRKSGNGWTLDVDGFTEEYAANAIRVTISLAEKGA